MREFFINSPSAMRPAMVSDWELVKEVIDGGPIVITVARLSKTRVQEKKYHAMINDIAKTVAVYGKRHHWRIWKALLVDQFEQEMIALGQPLSHPSETVVSTDGKRNITIRPSTRDFRKHEASNFIEFLYSQGCEMGAVWSEPSLKYYAEVQQAAKEGL